GAAYLLWFAFRSFKDAINPSSLKQSESPEVAEQEAKTGRHLVPAVGLRRPRAERPAVQAEGVALAERRNRLHDDRHRRQAPDDVGGAPPAPPRITRTAAPRPA